MVLGFMGLAFLLQIQALFAVAAGIGLVALISGRLAQLLHHGWMGLAKILGKIFPPLFMAVIYFVVLTPVGILARLFRKKPEANPESNFIIQGKRFTADDVKNMW